MSTVLGEGQTAPVKRFDRLAPCRSLVVVDLSQMQHMPLHRAPAGHTAVFNDAPIAVLLAVFAANPVAQKHGAEASKAASRFASHLVGTARVFRSFPRAAPAIFSDLSPPPDSKIPGTACELRKPG